MGFLVTVAFSLGYYAHTAEAPAGACLGGNHPAAACKTCETCFYCGKKGRWGNRPENSATCSACEKIRETKRP